MGFPWPLIPGNNLADLSSVAEALQNLTLGNYDNEELGATPTINWARGATQIGTLSADATFTFSAPPKHGRFTLILTEDGTGNHTVTLPGDATWMQGGPPAVMAAGLQRVFHIDYDGTSYFVWYSPSTADGLKLITTSTGTDQLTFSTPPLIIFTGTLAHNIYMPDVSTLPAGWNVRFINTASAGITLRSSGGTLIMVLPAGASTLLAFNGTAGALATSWTVPLVSLASGVTGTLGKPNGGTGEDNSTGGTANTFFGRPDGSTGAAAFRALVANDIPSLSSLYLSLSAGGTVGADVQISSPGSNANSVVVKSYVDALVQGLDVKASCRAATTANITLSGAQTIDDVSVIAGDRVLVKNQSTASQNGIYVAASGAWSRATDADADAEVTSGLFTFVSQGTVNGGTGWTLTTADPITVGSTSLAFTQFSGAGAYTAGSGLTLTGTQFSIGAGAVTSAMIASALTGKTYNGVSLGATYTNTASLGATPSLNLATNQNQSGTLTSNCTFTFTDPTVPCDISIILTANGTGGYTMAWPGNVIWADGVGPRAVPASETIEIGGRFDGANHRLSWKPFSKDLVKVTGTTAPADADMATSTAELFNDATAGNSAIRAKINDASGGKKTVTLQMNQPRVGSTTSSATPSINTDIVDIYRITALAANITSFTTNLSGTPAHGQKLRIEIVGTATRTIAWGSSFENGTNNVLPTTTIGTEQLNVDLTYNSTTSKWQAANGEVNTITFSFDGGGSAVTTGAKAVLYVPYSHEILEATLIGGPSGSMVVDVWKAAYSTSTLPTVANTITASAKPTLSSATGAQDATLTGWTKAQAAGSYRANIDSCSTITAAALTLKVRKAN